MKTKAASRFFTSNFKTINRTVSLDLNVENMEVSVKDEGAPKVQHYCLRIPLQPESFERHRLVESPICMYLINSVEEATFIRGLKFCFLTTLALALINLMIQNLLTPPLPDAPSTIFIQWLIGLFEVGRRVVLLAVFGGFLFKAFGMKMMTNGTGSTAQTVQTISPLVLQV